MSCRLDWVRGEIVERSVSSKKEEESGFVGVVVEGIWSMLFVGGSGCEDGVGKPVLTLSSGCLPCLPTRLT